MVYRPQLGVSCSRPRGEDECRSCLHVRGRRRSSIYTLIYLLNARVYLLAIDSVQTEQLRSSVEEVASRQPHFGERLPCRWYHCEQSVEQLTTLSGLNFCSLAQVTVQLCSFLNQPVYTERTNWGRPCRVCWLQMAARSLKVTFNDISLHFYSPVLSLLTFDLRDASAFIFSRR